MIPPEFFLLASVTLCGGTLLLTGIQLRYMHRLVSTMLVVSELGSDRVSVCRVFQAVARGDLTPEQGTRLLTDGGGK